MIHRRVARHTARGRWAPGLFLAILLAIGLTAPMFGTPRAVQAAPASQGEATISLAAELRSTLNRLGQEHVYLAGAAIAEALAGRDAAFQAAAGEVDENSVQLAKMVGAVYGSQAEQQFLTLWRDHIGFFVDYTKAASAGDQTGKEQALQNLAQYRQDVDALLTGANPNLPKGAVAQLFEPHVAHLTSAIDALAAGDAAKGYNMVHEAAQQTQNIMDPLAAAIVKQFPDRFAGDPNSAAATLLRDFNYLAEEHVYLSAYSLRALLLNAGFEAAAGEVDENSVQLAKMVGAVYGSQAEQQFLTLWRDHIGYFVDYTKAASAGDQAGKQQALNELDQYRQDIDALLTGANPNLPKGAVAQLFVPHVQHVTGTVDSLIAGDAATGYNMLHEAAHQTENIADPLVMAIVKQFPDKFPTAAAAPAAQPAPQPAAQPAPQQAPRQAPMPAGMPRTGDSGLAATSTLYTVQGGDSLWSISENVYGTPERVDDIVRHNADAIDDPDIIWPGMTLTLPGPIAVQE